MWYQIGSSDHHNQNNITCAGFFVFVFCYALFCFVFFQDLNESADHSHKFASHSGCFQFFMSLFNIFSVQVLVRLAIPGSFPCLAPKILHWSSSLIFLPRLQLFQWNTCSVHCWFHPFWEWSGILVDDHLLVWQDASQLSLRLGCRFLSLPLMANGAENKQPLFVALLQIVGTSSSAIFWCINDLVRLIWGHGTGISNLLMWSTNCFRLE